MDEREIELIKRLVDRLEHLSADSTYAHRASGVRGSLLRYVERLERGDQMDNDEQAQLDQLVRYGYIILARAAKEVGAGQ